MESKIREILNGNTGQPRHIEMTDKYREILKKIILAETELTKTLSKNQFEIFKNFDDLETELKSEFSEIYFTEGFKLGLLVGLECKE